MKKVDIELYTDYLLSTFGAATATGLSAMVDGEVSHDQVTRFLSQADYTSKDLWKQVKPVVRSIQKEEGVLIFDDTIVQKAWTDESELICWHYDHVNACNVKGINLLNALYHVDGVSIPVAFELIRKPIQFCDIKTHQVKRMSEVTKNDLMCQIVHRCIQNDLKFRFVLMDSWFASQDNFEFIDSRGKHFIAALKSNRLIALSEQERKSGCFTRVDELDFPKQNTVLRAYLKGYGKPVLLVRQVFTHKDGSTATLHLVCSDLTCDYETITTTYKKRWQVEVFHKSLKSNANLAKSPTRTLRTQSNHVFMSICAAFKLQCLSMKTRLNPFSLCRKLLINASRTAYQQLQLLHANTA